MSHKLLRILLLLLLITACSEKHMTLCPDIVIPRDAAYLTQKVNYRNEFQIELKGYEGFCFFDERIKRHKAVVTPIFVVQKLRNTDDFDVDFNFFVETVKGPPHYLGRKNYSANVTLAPGELEKEFKGSPLTIRIPSQDPKDFAIIMGLDLSRDEYRFNQRTFDIKYRYMTDETPDPVPYSSESIVYLTPQTPANNPAPAPASSGCNSCSL